MINWDDIKANRFGGDIFCNTYIEKFTTLKEVWDFLGFKLIKQRFGYSGIRNNIEYRLIKE